MDLREVPLSHVNQFAVGWMRVAFEQSRIIANLTSSGYGYAAAPNRREFWEIVLRLLWLADKPQEERESAADTMLQLSRDTEATTDKHMSEMGLDYLVGLGAIADFEMNPSTDKDLKDEAKILTKAVRSTETNGGVLYRLWREDSTWAHATGYLAGHYAPENGDMVGIGTPPGIDHDLEAHRLATIFVVFAVGYILTGEDVENSLASAHAVAFQGVR